MFCVRKKYEIVGTQNAYKSSSIIGISLIVTAPRMSVRQNVTGDFDCSAYNRDTASW